MFKNEEIDSTMNTPEEVMAGSWDQMGKLDVDSDEFAKGAESMAKLMNARAAEKQAAGGITKSQILGISATSALTLLGLHYETIHVITTKAFTYVKSIKF